MIFKNTVLCRKIKSAVNVLELDENISASQSVEQDWEKKKI